MIRELILTRFRFFVVVLATAVMATIPIVAPAATGAPVPSIVNEPTGQVLVGKMVWADLLTRDVAAAGRFYQGVFGWKISASDDPGYVTASVGGHPVASLASYDEEAPEDASLWLPSFSVEDVDGAVKRAETAGGTTLAPGENLPGRGRLAVIQDPQGGVCSLLRANSGDPLDGGKPAPGAWLWPEMWADEPAAAINFYTKVLALQAIVEKDGQGLQHHIMGSGDIARATAIQMPVAGVEPNWLLYLMVDELDTTLALVRQHGGKVLVQPQKSAMGGWVAIIEDNTGGVLGLQQLGRGK